MHLWLKKAARAWNEHLHSTLTTMGFIQNLADSCVYKKAFPTGYIIVATYVDDILSAATSSDLTTWFTEEFRSHYSITVNYPLTNYLGMTITKDPVTHDISLHQPGYIEQLISRFPFEPNSIDTPTVPMSPINIPSDSLHLPSDKQKNYMQLIGSLFYAYLSELVPT